MALLFLLFQLCLLRGKLVQAFLPLHHEGSLESDAENVPSIGYRLKYLIEAVVDHFALVSEEGAQAKTRWNERVNRDLPLFKILYIITHVSIPIVDFIWKRMVHT